MFANLEGGGRLAKGYFFYSLIWLMSASSFGAEAPLSTRQLWQSSLIFYNQGQFVEARHLLAKLVRQNPKNALYWFNLGNAYFMLGSFPEAETCFRWVEFLRSPLGPAARLYRAKALAARSETGQALEVLRQLLKSKMLTAAIRDQALRDLRALESPQTSGSSAMHLYRAGRYEEALSLLNQQDNSEENTILKSLVLLKLDREDDALKNLQQVRQRVRAPDLKDTLERLLERIPDGSNPNHWLSVDVAAGADSNIENSAEEEAGAVGLLGLHGGVRWWQRENWFLNLGYHFQGSEWWDHPRLRVVSHELRSNLVLGRGRQSGRISVFINHDSWGNKAVRHTEGVTLNGSRVFGRTEWGLDSTLAWSSSLSKDRDDLEGRIHALRLSGAVLYFPVHGRVYLQLERRAVGDLAYSSGERIPAANSGWGPRLEVLWSVSRSWVSEFSYERMMRDYWTRAEPGGRQRTDVETELKARVIKVFSPRFSGFFSLSHAEISSTLRAGDVIDGNSQRDEALLGMVWDVL